MNIGLMGNSLRPLIQQGMVYGYDIAANELVDSILQYSSAEKITCIYEPAQYQQAILRRKVKRMTKLIGNKNIEMVSEYDLLFHGVDSVSELDILHNVSSGFLPMIGLRENMRKKVPVTWTIHCASYPELLETLFLPMVLSPVKSYDALICTSNAVKEAVQSILSRVEHYTDKKCRVNLVKNPLGIDINKFSPREKKEIRSKYGIPQDAFVILWLGRISAADKADLYPLFVTFSRLLKANPTVNLKLVMAGYQPAGTDYISILEKTACMMGIQEHVIWMKNHDVSVRHELYNLSDVFTSPADNVQETFGITPIEAMACGIPQIVSDWDGYKDTVVDGVTGFRIRTSWSDCCNDISERGYLPFDINHRTQLYHYLTSLSVAVDLDEYQAAFQRLIDSEELYYRISVASRKRAVDNYDWKVIIKNMDAIWNDLIIKTQESDETFSPEKVLLPDYCIDFKSYPSCFVEDNIYFYRTKEVGNVDEILASIPKPYGIEDSLNDPLLLKKILQYDCSNIGMILEQYKQFTPNQIRRGYMYLYKYGLLRK